jgi:hypothetical protein
MTPPLSGPEALYCLDPATLDNLLVQRFMIHLSQDGPEIYRPGRITPDRETIYTGTAVLDRDGEWVLLRLYGKSYRTWATSPGWLRDLVAGRLVLAPARELLEEVLR